SPTCRLRPRARGRKRLCLVRGPCMKWVRAVVPVLILFATSRPARALGPEDVFLLVNKNVAASQEVADHYCLKRGVPRENIVVLDLPAGEDISRRDYNKLLLAPLRQALAGRRDRVQGLVGTYGVPLRVGGQEPGEQDRAELARLAPQAEKEQARQKELQQEIADLEKKVKEDGSEELARALKERRSEREAVQQRLKVPQARPPRPAPPPSP